MNFFLRSSSNCDNDPDNDTEFGLARQFLAFFLINLIAFLVYFTFSVYVSIKSSFKMDLKAWINLGVNAASFLIKGIVWTYMIIIYNENLDREPSMGELAYEKMLWDENGQLFLWDYFASFMIKMSIFAFIFEMTNIRVVLESETP